SDSRETLKKQQTVPEKGKEKSFEKYLKKGKLTKEQEEQFMELMNKYQKIYAIDGTKLGKTNVVQCEINTGYNKPIAGRAYKESLEHKKLIKEHVDAMLKDGVIEPANGPWASPVVIVPKKDGTKRFCVDYRRINNVTEVDAHPLPRIDELLELFESA